MSILTTTIGSYPKPDYIPTPDFFRKKALSLLGTTEAYTSFMTAPPDDLEALYLQGAREVIQDQLSAGIDILTDGEVRRENYIHYHCRHLQGFDFAKLTHKVLRDGTWDGYFPTIIGPIVARDRFLPHDWLGVQRFSDKPIKVTIPGPLTIIDSTADDYYGDERVLAKDLAKAINVEIKALAAAGCQWVQIDEPVFARYPEKALAFGVESLEHCFHGVPDTVIRTAHICCGYPDRLDNEAYPKADPETYFQLAPALDESSLQAISIEDAHRHNDLRLLEEFKNTQIILGLVAIARSRVEPVEEIRERLENALDHINKERLIAAPDCGLGMLDRGTAIAKMTNLSRVAHSV